MTRHLLFLCLIISLSVFKGQAQTKTQFNGSYTITYLNALGSRQFQINGTFLDANNVYQASDVQVGDMIVDLNGNMFKILTVSVVGSTINTTSQAYDDQNPVLGKGIISTPTSNGFPLITANAPTTAMTSVLNTATISIDENLAVYTSGAIFPTANAKYGDVFYNTDEDKLYMMDDNGAWINIKNEKMSFGPTASIPLTANLGDFYYDTDRNILFLYNNSLWAEVSINGSTPVGTTNPAQLSGNVKEGNLFFNTVDKRLYVYNNAAWMPIDNALPNGKIYVGNPSGVAKAVTLNGDAYIDNSGALTIANGSITNSKLSKLNIPLSGFGGAIDDVDMGGNRILNLANPAGTQDAATRGWVETALGSPSSFLVLPSGQFFVGNLSGKAMATTKSSIPISGFGAAVANISMGTSFRIMNMADPTNAQDAATKSYVDTRIIATDHVSLTNNSLMIGAPGNIGSSIAKNAIPLSDFGAATANISMGTSYKIINMLDPSNAQDAATKQYVDTRSIPLDQISLTDKYFIVGASNNVGAGIPKNSIPLSGFGAATADVAMGDGTNFHLINYVANPVSDQDAATKYYVDDLFMNPSTALALPTGQFFVGSGNKATATSKNNIPLSGFGAATADVAMGDATTMYSINYLANPLFPQDAATKDYVDTRVANPNSITLPENYILVGNSAGVAEGVNISNDATITSTGALTISNGAITNSKLDKSNIPLSGFGAAAADVTMGGNKITGMADPTAAEDAATKGYVDTQVANPSLMNLSSGNILVGDAANKASSVAMSGDATIDNTGKITIANDAVTAAKLNIDVAGTGLKQNAVTGALEVNPSGITGGSVISTDLTVTGGTDAALKNVTIDIKNGAVTSTKLASAAVTESKIALAAVTESKIALASVTESKIAPAAVTESKLNKSNIPLSGFGAAAADVAMGGNKLTGLADPTELEDAATKGYVDTQVANPSLMNLSSGNILVGDAANKASSVAISGDATIDNTGKLTIANDAVTAAKLNIDVAGTGLKQNALTGALEVNPSGITGGSVSSTDLTVTGGTDAALKNVTIDIAEGAVTESKLANDAVTAAKLNIDVAGTGLKQNAATGALEVDPSGITGGSVSSTDLTVTGGTDAALKNVTIDIAEGAITESKLATAAVTESKLAAGAVTENKIAQSAVTEGKLATAAVTESKLAAGAVTENKIGLSAVTEGKIATAAVTESKLANDAVTAAKLNIDVAGTGLKQNAVTGALEVNPSGITGGSVSSTDLTVTGGTDAALKNVTINIAEGAVTEGKIETAAVTESKLDKANIPLSGFGAATADVAMGGNKLTGLADPTAVQDAATKGYVDNALAQSADNLGNHSAAANLKMNGYLINNDGGNNEGLSFADDGQATFAQDLTINGNLFTPSDERLKTNIETLTNVLEKIDQMRGVQFEYKDQKKYVGGSKIGVIAQELQLIFPELVTIGSDGFLKVDYTQLTAILIQAVKEQQHQINELKTDMLKLQEQIKEIQKKLE